MDNLDFNFYCQGCEQTMEYRRANCFTKYRLRQFKKGEYLTFTGDIVKELSLVVSGAINVSFVRPNGFVTRSVNHQAPVPIGGVALLSKRNRYRVDTMAIEDCSVISVSREEVVAQMGRCDNFLTNFIDFAASRVDALTSHLAVLTQRSVKAKLAHYILANSDGGRYDFGRSVKSLAEYLCVERPSLSRVISQLVADGVITYRVTRGEICDVDELKRIVDE